MPVDLSDQKMLLFENGFCYVLTTGIFYGTAVCV